MDRRASIATHLCALLAVPCMARDASAFRPALGAALAAERLAAANGSEEPWWKVPVSSRARLNVQLTAEEAGAPWSWDAQSRSPLDDSRFMIDVTAGDARTGTLYAKGAATWRDAEDADGRVAFAIEQGDYRFRGNRAEVRAFGDERRFFTGELGAASMDDDAVERFQHRIGVRADADAGALGGTLLYASLDEGSDTRGLSYARARVATAPVAVSASYQHQDGDARDHAIAKGEVAGFWKRATVVASYEQSGFGSGVFLPDGDWDSFGEGYAGASPENSAAFFEARLARSSIGRAAVLAGVYRYGRVGDAYTNDLASLPAGTELHRLGLYVSHRRYALDGRVVLFDAERSAAGYAGYDERGVAASARAFLNDNSEMNLRGAVVDATRDDGEERTTGSAHAIYRRSLQRFMGGVDALVDEIGADAVTRVGVETRINWSATSALYLRWIASGAVERSDAVYLRLEFRPTARTWVTFAYGRAVVGDGPYLLEDDDALPAVDTEDVFTIVVRGDF
jgi:hypothetical protein